MQSMPSRIWCVAAAIAAIAALGPAGTAAAQASHEYPGGRLAAGGEVTAVLGPADDIAFFNYTDYDHNALRVARLRLFGEWRTVADRVSIVGELRTENGTDLDAPALYLRWRPAAAGRLWIQAGRIPPVIGAFARRAYGRDNAVLGLPLIYQYLTSLRPDALPRTPDDLLRMRGRGWQPSFPIGSPTVRPGISVLSVSRWDTGVEGTWSNERFDLSAAVTQGSPAVPVVSDRNGGRMVSARVGAHLPSGVTLGVSGGRGQWLDDTVLALTPGGADTPSSQAVMAADAEVGLGPWLVRSEWVRSSFELPIATLADPDARLVAWGGFVEARYQLRPRWQIGGRFDRLDFSRVASPANGGALVRWDAPVTRVEATVAYRVSRRIDVRGGWQHNWRSAGRVHDRGFPTVAALYWF